MPNVTGVPGGASPNKVGQFYVPPKPEVLPYLDDDTYVPQVLNRALIASLFLPVSFLVPWAGSYDERVQPTYYEEDSWIPPVLKQTTTVSILVGGTNQSTPPPTVVDEEYNHRAPITWPQRDVRLSWPDEDFIAKLQALDNDEWIPQTPPQVKYNSVILWTGNDDTVTATLVGDEGELLPRVPVTPAVSKLLDWQQDEVANAPAEESEWLPKQTQASWLNTALELVSNPQDEITRLSPEDEEGWFPPPPHSQWQSSVVIDSNGDSVPQVIAPFEEDAWIPVPPIFITNVRLLIGGSEPAAPVTTIVDEDYSLQVSKLISVWTPQLVSDPTDYPIPVAVAFEELAQGVTLVPPFVTTLISPWSYSGGEDAAPSGILESEWVNPVAPVVFKYDARFVGRDAGELALVVAIIGDEPYDIAHIPLQILRGPKVWSFDQNDIASVATPLQVSEDYELVRVGKLWTIITPKQWLFEQNEQPVFVPPEVCIEGPVSVTITLETPNGTIITLEGPMTVAMTSESPAALGVTLEGASPLVAQTEVPTETECND